MSVSFSLSINIVSCGELFRLSIWKNGVNIENQSRETENYMYTSRVRLTLGHKTQTTYHEWASAAM